MSKEIEICNQTIGKDKQEIRKVVVESEVQELQEPGQGNKALKGVRRKVEMWKGNRKGKGKRERKGK